MRASVGVLFIGTLAAAGTAHASNERMLFENSDYQVMVAEDYYCGEPIKVTVHSSSPRLFEGGSVELQRIVDASQAVLAFECPDVHVVEVEGWLTGLGDPVYAGAAEQRSNWELSTLQSIQSEEYEDEHTLLGEDLDHEGTGEGFRFTVANLAAGMSIDEARATVADTFGAEGEYDVEEGILRMQAGGCPADYDWGALSPAPAPGWKCLQAWFTDQRVARLYLLELVQVVDAAAPAMAEWQLIERFGEPAYRGTREQQRGWWQESQVSSVLAWGDVVEPAEASESGELGDIHDLQAEVLIVDDVTVVIVTLYDPSIRPQWAADQPEPKLPDLTL